MKISFWKLIAPLLLVFMIIAVSVTPAFAADPEDTNKTNNATAGPVVGPCDKDVFFGLVPWYQYLELDADCNVESFIVLPNDSETSDIPLVLLAVIDDLLRVSGLIAVIFILYGGILYVTSQGNPDQTSRAQSTIINALAGLAVAIVAVAFVSFIGNTFK